LQIPEIVAAHHAGMKILCLSVITNKVIIDGSEGTAASHQEVLDAANQCAKQIQSLIVDIVSNSSQYMSSLRNLGVLPPLKDTNNKQQTRKIWGCRRLRNINSLRHHRNQFDCVGLRIGGGVHASFVLKEITRHIKIITSFVGHLANSSSPILDPFCRLDIPDPQDLDSYRAGQVGISPHLAQ
jgi:hypothetical protein